MLKGRTTKRQRNISRLLAVLLLLMIPLLQGCAKLLATAVSAYGIYQLIDKQ